MGITDLEKLISSFNKRLEPFIEWCKFNKFGKLVKNFFYVRDQQTHKK